MWSGTNLKTSLFTSAQVFTLASRRLTSTDLNICAELNSATWLADTQPMFPTWLHVAVVSSVQAGATCTVWLGNQCLLSSCQPGKIKPTARNKFLPSTHRHTYLPETRPTMTDQCYEKMRKRKQPLVHLGQQECVKTYCWARPDLAVRGSALPQWNDHNQNTD